jgi:ABC-type branched-subunit amino acid transport system ATPase component
MSSTSLSSERPSTPARQPSGAGFALSVRDAARSFGGVHAVAGATFDVREGTITGLIGPNGAGKSTLVGGISGAIRLDRGEVTFFDSSIAGRSQRQVAQLGVARTYQLSSEFRRLTVLENLLVGARHQPGESPLRALLGPRFWRAAEYETITRARELLAQFKMSEFEDAYAGELSGGQKRLVEIMRALMSEPRFLLLDEPMAGVSPVRIREIEGFLAELRTAGMTMLLVEHELDTIERLCDEVVVMAQGRVLAVGTMAELRDQKEVVDAYLAG